MDGMLPRAWPVPARKRYVEVTMTLVLGRATALSLPYTDPETSIVHARILHAFAHGSVLCLR